MFYYQTSVQKTKWAGMSSDFIGLRCDECRVLVVCLPLLSSYSTVFYDRSMLFSTWRCTQGSAADWIPHIPACPLIDHARAVSRGCERLVLLSGWGVVLFRAHTTLAPFKKVLFTTPIAVLAFFPQQHHQPPKPWPSLPPTLPSCSPS